MAAYAGHVALGAPGIYRASQPPLQALTGVRMDVCAFVGVAPRGPARVPVTGEAFDAVWPADGVTNDPARPRRRSVGVRIDSWSDYRRLYGSFEIGSMLPRAVASFFEQGGRRAWVVRVVHDYEGPDEDPADNDRGVAAGLLIERAGAGAGTVRLLARNEGLWGDRLQATLSFASRPVAFVSATTTELTVTADTWLPAGTLLRLRFADGTRALRFVTAAAFRARPDLRVRDIVATLELATVLPAVDAEIVEGILDVIDTDPLFERRQRHERLGLSSDHPRWAAGVLCTESDLVWPDPAWTGGEIRPADPALPIWRSAPFEGGEDRHPRIVPEDFFDRRWVPGDDGPADGVHAVVDIEELSLLAVPDLYAVAPVLEREWVLDTWTGSAAFECCVEPPVEGVQEPAAAGLDGLRLDPNDPVDLRTIIGLQGRLVELAERIQSFIVLLDVPPGLHHRQILGWRSCFASSYAAGYHPWLTVAGTDRPVPITPSAVAAGIIARREATRGIPFGPANELGVGVVNVRVPVSPDSHDELHQAGVNVYLLERDGVRLWGARTLSSEPQLRQISVRRLMTMLRRTLEREMQWAAFEPNDVALQARVRHMLESFLRQLYAAGAFRGATQSDAFYVRCDETLNTVQATDAGQLVAEVGVAPSEPLEFIVLTIVRGGDGTLQVEGRRG